MHPAYSVILFTTASGAGYGLLFWLSLATAFGWGPENRWLAFAAMALALLLVTAGLVSSTLHLGRPERALGAFSEWRTSWLSREGVVAVATYAPAGLLALIWMFGLETGLEGPLGLLAAAGAVATVYCTGMIYASLRTIRQWNLPIVPQIYLALAAATGAVFYGFVLSLGGAASVWVGALAVAGIAVSALLKLRYWKIIDADENPYTTEMATGLGHIGKVRPLDPPHTRPNFVMREMGYEVGRKHAEQLRRITLLLLFAIPGALALLAMTASMIAPLFYLLAVLCVAMGVVMERWLFFAEAEHVSMLYYRAS